MKRICLTFFIMFFLLAALLPAQRERDLYKGIAYYLINDAASAKSYFDLYFKNTRLVHIRNGFSQLLLKKDREAAREFNTYLNMNHRSTIALVGIALATSTMINSNPAENLKRALRLNSGYSPAHLCLGFFYMKEKNYPLAEKHLNRAYRFAKIPEYKILLSNLYFLFNEPKVVLSLVKKEADLSPDNYYFNYLTAKAYFFLNQIADMQKYIENARDTRPNSSDAKLLMAKYLLATNETKRAKTILKDLTYDYYNEDYKKTMAHTLFKLGDRKAKDYLYEVFAQNKWDPLINKLMGLYYQQQRKKGNLQNWIYRAILSGNAIESLKEQFKGEYNFPQYLHLPFFAVSDIKWLSNDLLLVAAEQNSGDPERIYFIDANKMKILKTLNYTGNVHTLIFSNDREKIVFSTEVIPNEKYYMYAVSRTKNNYRLRGIGSYKVPSILMGLNRSGTLAYFTSGSISSMAFESPFSSVSQYGQKKPIYPSYPFIIYQYNFSTGRLTRINDASQKRKVPINEVQSFYLVAGAFQLNDKVKKLIEKGQKLDLTSNEIVRIFIADDQTGFIIYLSDLKSPFQALVYDSASNQVTTVEAEMFLGSGQYVEVKLLYFLPKKNEIMLLTKDKKRNVINYNYKTRLYNRLIKDMVDFCYDPNMDTIYLLKERSNKLYYIETSLEIYSLNPFGKKRIGSRRDLNKITFCDENKACIQFATYDGELLKLDEEDQFQYLGPGLQGCINATAPSLEQRAAFINGRLFILNDKK